MVLSVPRVQGPVSPLYRWICHNTPPPSSCLYIALHLYLHLNSCIRGPANVSVAFFTGVPHVVAFG